MSCERANKWIEIQKRKHKAKPTFPPSLIQAVGGQASVREAKPVCGYHLLHCLSPKTSVHCTLCPFSALGGSSALHIPAFPGGGCLIDYVPQVCHLLTNKVNTRPRSLPCEAPVPRWSACAAAMQAPAVTHLSLRLPSTAALPTWNADRWFPSLLLF